MIQYRLATEADSQQLIALTSTAAMEGETALRIDRKPDFFELLKMRGNTKVFIAEDGNSIIGSLCVSLQEVFVGGQILPLQYIGDFKVLKAYRNKGIGLQLCNNMADYLMSVGADLAFLNISKGNTKPLSFFKNRPKVPDFECIGLFNIHQFIGKKISVGNHDYEISETPATDELIKFLNLHYSKYELGSVITMDKLKGAINYIIHNGNGIKAAMCLIDTMPVKQNVVTALTFKMKWILKVANTVSGIMDISKMPVLNQPVKMMYVKYLAVENGNKGMVKWLINHARNIVYDLGYSFVSIGLHSNDPMNKCFSGLLKLTFNSVGMLISIKNNQALINQVKNGVPFEDYSLV